MADNWQDSSLGDLIDVKHGFAFQGEFIHDGPGGDILVTPGNFAIGGGFKADKFKYYDGPIPDEFILAEGDLLVTMTDLSKQSDTLGFAAFVPARLDTRRYLHNQRIGRVLVKDERALDVGYLHYLLCSASYRNEVLASATGTTVKHTSPERIKRFKFSRPPLTEQRAIAHILGTMDAKIELNRCMNETLEAMARALFKSWFVDFDPVRAKTEGRPPNLPQPLADLFSARLVDSELGEIPEGWNADSIYTAADVIYGAPFSSAQFDTERLGEPLIRIRDLTNESPGVWTPELHPKGYKVKPGDIVVGMDGEFRAYLWGGDEAWLNQRVCVFAPKTAFSAAFVRNSIFEPLAHIEATETATTVIHLGKSDIDRFSIVVPSPALLGAFNQCCQPWYDRIVAAKRESRTLAALRDTLLPKLISGDLRVRDAERSAARASA